MIYIHMISIWIDYYLNGYIKKEDLSVFTNLVTGII